MLEMKCLRWRAVGKRREATRKPLGGKLIQTDWTPEHDAVQAHTSISHNDNAAFEPCFSCRKPQTSGGAFMG